MPHLTPIQTARAIAKLEENWSLAAVARKLHCSKTCIFNIKRRWQENRLERPIRIGVGKVSLLKFTFILIMYYLLLSLIFMKNYLLQLFLLNTNAGCTNANEYSLI
jgi:hypothetical protein